MDAAIEALLTPQVVSWSGAHASSVLALLLPTAAGRPLPSPNAAGAPTHTSGSAIGIQPWAVSTRALEPGRALEVLAAALDADADGTVGSMGASLRYLATLAHFSLTLAATGRIVPALLDAASGGLEARWLPAPGDGQVRQLRRLLAAMPPLCRAETRDAHDRTGQSAAEVVAACLEAFVDVAVREALAAGAYGSASRRRDPVSRWLAALHAPKPSLSVEAGELAALSRALASWRRSVLPADRPFRTCLRLGSPAGDDPAGDDAAWPLDLLLQATDDPSLIVPADEVWEAGRALVRMGRRLDHPGERLLADLGRASRLYPPLEAALTGPRPTGLRLDASGAHRFLSEGAPVLADAGLGILLPAWWRAGRPRLGLRLKARSRGPADAVTGTAGLGMETLVDYRWEVALGDGSLTIEELQELARLKAPLVRVRGQWVELQPDDLKAALRLVEQGPGSGGEATVREMLRSGLGLEATDTVLPISGMTAEGWLGNLLSDAGSLPPQHATTPRGFNGTLRPYQERGLGWLTFLGERGLGACLADDMGLGKTAQLLALLVAERAGRPEGPVGGSDVTAGTASVGAPAHLAPTLVVCPMSVAGNWQREAERFAPHLSVHVHHGADRLDAGALAEAVADVDLVITTYSLALRDAGALSAIEWSRICLDEAQNIKNSSSLQAQAIRRLSAPRRVALTGTPVENRLSELWSIMEFLNPGLLGSAKAFRTRFAVPIERYRDEHAAALLRRLSGPFILRRLKSDKSIIADLPEKLEMTVFCNLTREQATLYQAVVDEMLERIDSSEGIERRGLILTTMLRLKQVCNHPALLLGDGSAMAERSGKLQRVEAIIEELLAEGDRALCFTQFAEFGAALQARLRERFHREVLFLHGGTPKKTRDEMVARFQSGTGPSIFVLSLKAGGTGINLTAANHVIHVDRWWNPAVEDQASDRAYRIGQRRNVQVRKLVCVGTLEERIAAMIDAKRELAERVVGTGEGWLTELSTAELRTILTLSADSVGEA